MDNRNLINYIRNLNHFSGFAAEQDDEVQTFDLVESTLFDSPIVSFRNLLVFYMKILGI